MIPSEEFMTSSDQLSIGIIGTGGMGKRHAVNLHQHVGGARVAAVYDVDPGRAHAVAAEAGWPAVLDDPLALVGDPSVDAVVIASPDATHAALVQECLRCQKPVLCEKPLATSLADALQVVAAEQALGRRLISVGLMRRFDPQHLAVREIAASGRLGRPILFKGVHRNAAIPYDARGEVILTNSASHDVDTARWLTGQEVEEVFVRGVRSHPSFSEETIDLLLLQLTLSDACLATVELYAAAEYGYEVSAELVCQGGTVQTAQPREAIVRAAGVRGTSVPADWLGRFQAAYIAELAAWARSVQAGRPWNGASAWDGAMALRVTDACVQSLHSGQPVALRPLERPAAYA
jgi:myo-inositol 2-dehydrogenase/D-chiro-inositol 1-dehydrogenase